MKICLFAEVYELLLKNVPRETPAYAALLAATKINGRSSVVFDQYYVECSDADADMYLAAAEERLGEILTAIRYNR